MRYSLRGPGSLSVSLFVIFSSLELEGEVARAQTGPPHAALTLVSSSHPCGCFCLWLFFVSPSFGVHVGCTASETQESPRCQVKDACLREGTEENLPISLQDLVGASTNSHEQCGYVQAEKRNLRSVSETPTPTFFRGKQCNTPPTLSLGKRKY